MALSSQRQWRSAGQRWNAWTALLLVLVALSSWVPVSNASVRSPRHLHRRESIADGVDLRVLPIGDSITWGAKSSDSNGYRKYLWDRLAKLENKLDFVGRRADNVGMSDPEHEGHRGKVIDEISDMASIGISAAPNIVLLHAGTNDMNKDLNTGEAPARLKNLIDKILKVSPKAVVLVCQIVPSTKAETTQPRIETFNAAIPGLVHDLRSEGKKALVVAMNEAVQLSDIADDLHPNDRGYQKMANEFYDAIQLASSMGWITEPGTPVTPTGSTATQCRPTPSWTNVGTIAAGAKVAYADPSFSQAWASRGVVHDGDCPRDRLHFMDLDGDGLKDYACVDADTGKTKVMLNIPGSNGKWSGKWGEAKTIASGNSGRLGSGVRFADLNGDGRDDYIYVHPVTGDITAWINRGEGTDGASWQWQSLSVIASGIGATNKNLQFVDLNGDHRADLCLVNQDSGEVKAWINNGGSIIPDWYRLDTIATGASKAPDDSVILGDFTGEGRADYMMVGAKGKVVGFINRLQEETILPRWLGSVVVAEGPGDTERDEVRLVDITGDGKADYLRIEKKSGKVTLWENMSTGGKYQPGEGVFLCDLDGDGAKDYFWVDHEGAGWGYLNKGKGSNVWNDLGQIMKNNPHDRESIRMGVLTKSGRADYIVVDKDKGQAWFWRNLGPEAGWSWGGQSECAAGPKETLRKKFGWEEFYPENVRFADLDGDGLDDYIYMNNYGATVWWKNLGTLPITWGPATLVADGPAGVIPQDVHFADTNGDGKLDYVVVGRVNGQTRTWHHLGWRDDGSIRWDTPRSFADRTGSTGSAIRIADMTGDGRADYVSVDPNNGRLDLWHNRCWPLESSGGGSSGESDELTWRDIDCTSPGANDSIVEPSYRWNTLRASEAWEDALDEWRSLRGSTTFNFSIIIANYFHTNDLKNCGNMMEENNCYETVDCDEDYGGAAPFLVLNSLIVLSQTFWNIINLFGDAATDVKGSIGVFAKTFAPPEREDGIGLYVILDIVAMGYASIMAPFWNKWARNLDWSRRNSDDFDTIKDLVNDMTYQGITLAKDLITQEDKGIDPEALLEDQVSGITRAWRGGMESYAKTLFNGSEASIKKMTKLMASGKLIDPGSQLDNVGAINLELKKTLYGMLIPMAWRVAGRDLNPFILDSGRSCQDAPNDEWIQNVLGKDTRNDRMICDKGKNRAYYLVGAVDPSQNCKKAGWDEETAECKDFEDLPGFGELGTRVGMSDEDADSSSKDWGLLSAEDIVLGSLATFKANGYKNTPESKPRAEWNSLDQWEETLDALVDNDIRAPYFFDLPVCNAVDAFLNYKREGEGETSKKNRKYYFPCNEVIDWDIPDWDA